MLSGKTAVEKKRILADEYGMVMTAELEGRLQIMCNLSENIEARGIKEGMKEGIKEGIKKGIDEGIKKGIDEGIKKERIAAIERMIKANATRGQILLYGYTEEEYVEAENSMCMNA